MQVLVMTLDELLHGKSLEEFFHVNWGAKPCHFTRSPLSLETPETLLSSLLSLPRLRYPQVRILNGEGALNPFLYTASCRHELSEVINNDKVRALAIAPNTIKIEELASLHPVFENWANLLGRLFSSRITLNGYFSFGPSDGIPIHYDPHHIFAIQLYGEKTWSLGLNQSELFPHSALTMSDNLKHDPSIGLKLKAGEMLYLPPGRLHSVRTESHSVHIAAGIHTPRCFQAISGLLDKAAASHPELRSDMPFNVSSQGVQFRPLTEEELDMAFRLLKAEQVNANDLKHG
jgi:lysine-specific demethylase/histidyl-hydroxylase NO66